MKRPIVLLTDFGYDDWFVGHMKGVIAGIAPQHPVIDLNHMVTPGAVSVGAFVLRVSLPHFPEESVFCCVVDPGVGTERDAILVLSGDRLFVGPDNGLFTPVFENDPACKTHIIQNKDWFHDSFSSTFHGRDVFAPVAAHLATGRSPEDVGPRQNHPRRLEGSAPERENGRILTQVLYVDRFGNVITGVPGEWIVGKSLRVAGQLLPVAKSYGHVASGSTLAYVGSTGLLEIGVNGGRAADRFNLSVGQEIQLQLE